MKRMLIFAIALIVIGVFSIVITANGTSQPQAQAEASVLPNGSDTTNSFVMELVGAAIYVENQRIAAEQEAARIAAEQEAARIAAEQRSTRAVTIQAMPSTPSECEGKVIPAYVIWRESHCNYGSVNWNGCGGYNCYGMYQIDGRHWSNWNGTPGACSDLDWTIPAHQDECANRLSSGGTNLRPWGG